MRAARLLAAAIGLLGGPVAGVAVAGPDGQVAKAVLSPGGEARNLLAPGGWEDLGFRIKEGTNETAWDDAHDGLSVGTRELLTGRAVQWSDGKTTLTLGPEAVAVIELEQDP